MTTINQHIENYLCLLSNNSKKESTKGIIVDILLFLFYGHRFSKNKRGLLITKNVDSFKFVIRKFYNIKTNKTWWLINLIWYTICTNNKGENYD